MNKENIFNIVYWLNEYPILIFCLLLPAIAFALSWFTFHGPYEIKPGMERRKCMRFCKLFSGFLLGLYGIAGSILGITESILKIQGITEITRVQILFLSSLLILFVSYVLFVFKEIK